MATGDTCVFEACDADASIRILPVAPRGVLADAADASGWAAPICDDHWPQVEAALADPDHRRLWVEADSLYVEVI